MKKYPPIGSIVFVIDGTSPNPASLKQQFASDGLQTEPFGLAETFLLSPHPDAPCCLAIEVRVPDLKELEYRCETATVNAEAPIVLITGHGDIPVTVQNLKAGRAELLPSTCNDQMLRHTVRATIKGHKSTRMSERLIAQLKARFSALTAREKEVINFVTSGFLNKEIAAEMGIREATVKLHRGNIMRKMQARSLVDLVRMVDILAVTGARPAAH
jgi:FixJ family two-component response regulator